MFKAFFILKMYKILIFDAKTEFKEYFCTTKKRPLKWTIIIRKC